MSVFEELNALLESMGISVETGVFSDSIPVAYVVLTPLSDTFDCFADNKPQAEVNEVRLSLFSKTNYLNMTQNIVTALLDADFTITQRKYIGHEDNSGYHHYAIDVAKEKPLEEKNS